MAVEIARVTARPGSGERRLEVEGELEIGTVALLDDAVASELAAGGRRIVIDLTPTTFVDSSGLAALLRASKEVGLRDGALAVVAPHGHEARLLIELSGTAGVLGLQEA